LVVDETNLLYQVIILFKMLFFSYYLNDYNWKFISNIAFLELVQVLLPSYNHTSNLKSIYFSGLNGLRFIVVFLWSVNDSWNVDGLLNYKHFSWTWNALMESDIKHEVLATFKL
jgi:hypothetical protein